MYSYAASSASASTFSTFTSPPQTTNPGGLAGQAGAVAQAAGTQAGSNAQTTSAQLMSSVPQALQSLSTPGSSSGAGLSQAAAGTAASLGSSGASAPISALSSLTGARAKAPPRARALGGGNRLDSSLTSALGGNRDGMSLTRSAWAPMWPAWAPMVRAWAPTAVDLVSTRTACAWISRARVRLRGPRGLAVCQAWEAGGLGWSGSLGLGVWGKAHRRAWVKRPRSGPCRCRRVGPTRCRRSRRCPRLDANVMPGGWGAAPSAATGPAGISKLPLGGMVGRESEGAVQRIGFRPSLIPRSPVAG